MGNSHPFDAHPHQLLRQCGQQADHACLSAVSLSALQVYLGTGIRPLLLSRLADLARRRLAAAGDNPGPVLDDATVPLEPLRDMYHVVVARRPEALADLLFQLCDLADDHILHRRELSALLLACQPGAIAAVAEALGVQAEDQLMAVLDCVFGGAEATVLGYSAFLEWSCRHPAAVAAMADSMLQLPPVKLSIDDSPLLMASAEVCEVAGPPRSHKSHRFADLCRPRSVSPQPSEGPVYQALIPLSGSTPPLPRRWQRHTVMGSPLHLRRWSHHRHRQSSRPHLPDLHWHALRRELQKDLLGPFPRHGHAVCPIGPQTALLVGGSGRLMLDDVWIFDLDTGTWQRQANQQPAPPASKYHTLVASTRSAFLFGGYTSFTSAEVWQYDILRRTWCQHRRPASPASSWPSARYGHSAVLLSGRDMVVFGGWLHGSGWPCNELWVCDTSTILWRQIQPPPAASPAQWPAARYHHAAVALDDYRILVLGGCGANEQDILHDSWLFNFHTGEWQQLHPQPHHSQLPAIAHGAAVLLPISNAILFLGPQHHGTNKAKSCGHGVQHSAAEVGETCCHSQKDLRPKHSSSSGGGSPPAPHSELKSLTCWLLPADLQQWRKIHVAGTAGVPPAWLADSAVVCFAHGDHRATICLCGGIHSHESRSGAHSSDGDTWLLMAAERESPTVSSPADRKGHQQWLASSSPPPIRVVSFE